MNLIQIQILFRLAGKQLKNILKTVAGNDFYLQWQFDGNILEVGHTGCGKTTFLEKLGLNNFFGNIIKTEWISGIAIDKQREAKIQSYFSNKTEVHVEKEQDELNSLSETFKLPSREESNDNDNVNNSFGENKKLDRFITMDDVSGVPDTSKKLANFLTISRKFSYNCIYVFHLIVPVRSLWLNRAFTDLANSHEKHCLAIDCGYMNKNGSGRYR